MAMDFRDVQIPPGWTIRAFENPGLALTYFRLVSPEAVVYVFTRTDAELRDGGLEPVVAWMDGVLRSRGVTQVDEAFQKMGIAAATMGEAIRTFGQAAAKAAERVGAFQACLRVEPEDDPLEDPPALPVGVTRLISFDDDEDELA